MLGKRFIRPQHIKISETVQKSNSKIVSKKLQNTTINLPSHIFNAPTLIPQASFFIHFVEFLPHIWIRKDQYSSYVSFLRNWHRKTTKYERAIQASVDNTGNDLRHKINFENCVKNKSNLFIEHSLSLKKQKYLFLILGSNRQWKCLIRLPATRKLVFDIRNAIIKFSCSKFKKYQIYYIFHVLFMK